MKYIGEKSVSSFISKLLPVLFWLMLAAAVVYVLTLIINLFGINAGDPITSTLSKWDMSGNDNNLFLFFRWNQVTAWPVAGKVIVAVVWAACIALNLALVEKARQLFRNFRKDIVFDSRNARIIGAIAKLMIVLSVVTWSLYSLVVSILLLILGQIFQRGAALQEDQNLTV
jgi:hypothetical protein